MDEPIRLFSDLHLAHPACRVESVDQLAPLFEGARTVIFNGDTTEQRHSLLRENGERQLNALKELLADRGIAAHFLRGNHDPRISEIDHLDLANGQVLVTHGDALFRHLSPWSPKVWKVVPQMEAVRAEYGEARLESDLAACLEYTHRCRGLSAGSELEFKKTGPFPKLRSLARIAWPPLRPVRILRTWQTIPAQAHAFAERYRPEAKVILFGHTHFPGIWKRDGRVAINTGGFMSVIPARAIEISGGRLVVRKIEEGSGLFQLGTELASIELFPTQ